MLDKISQEIDGVEGWIPCSKRLPEAWCVDPDMDPEDIVWPEYIVTIKGASESTILRYDFQDNTWFDDKGCLYEVAAWQPFPAPYCPRQMVIGDSYRQRIMERFLKVE